MVGDPDRDAVVFSSVHPILAVTDLPAALAYYGNRLGFEVSWQWGDPPVRAGVRLGDLELHLVADGRFAPAHPTYVYFHMRGVDRYYRACVERQATIETPLDDRSFGMRDFRVRDPDGNALGFGEASSDE